MTHSSIGRLALGTVLAVSLGAWDCGGSDNPGGTPDAGGTSTADAPPVTGPYSHYVTSAITLGSSTTDAKNNGFDLDGDGAVDNALGNILANFQSQLKIDAAIAGALAKGSFVVLHSLHGNTTTAAAATWQLYVGKSFTPPAMPDLTSGNGTFMIDTSVAAASPLAGAVSAAKFTTTTPGNLNLQITFIMGGNPITIPLKAARIESTLTATGCTGKIGGGILKSDIEGTLYPAIADTLTHRFADDGCKPGPCSDPQDATVASFVDTGCPANCTPCTGTAGDYVVTADEIRCGTIGTVLTPDVDLVKADGSPGKDGTKDSVSIGVGFSCTKANFTAAGEQ
jgi:hypothetical protein